MSRDDFVDYMKPHRMNFSETAYFESYFDINWNFLWHHLHIGFLETQIVCRKHIFFDRPNTRMKWWVSEIGEGIAVIVLICIAIQSLIHKKKEIEEEIEQVKQYI